MMHSQWVSIASVQKIGRNSHIHRAVKGKDDIAERWEENVIHKENWIFVLLIEWYI